MAAKKPAKSKKALGKKTMKKTKGGILIGLNQPALFHKDQPLAGPTLSAPSLFFKF